MLCYYMILLFQERVSTSGSESESSSDSDSGRESGHSESDNSNSNVQIKNTKENKLLKTFQNENKLKQIKSETKFNVNNIDPKDEVFLLQIPKSFDANLLKGQILFPGDATKVVSETGDYFFELESFPEKSVMLLSSEKNGSCNIKGLKPTGMIRMKHPKKKYKTHIPFFSSELCDIPLPFNLKNKHPILGADYKKEMNIDESIKNKLKDCIVSSKKTLKKEPKHVNEEEEQKHEDELIFKMLDESTSRTEKKTKKQKSNTANVLFSKLKEDMNVKNIKKEEFEDEEEATESVVLKKKRKRKHTESQDESTITEEPDERGKSKKQKTKHSHTEEIEFDTSIVKKEETDFQILATSSNSLIQEHPHKKHKKMKQEIVSDNLTDFLDETQFDKADEMLNGKRKHKKHKDLHEIVNSTMMSPNVGCATFNIELSQINVDASVKKKNKTKVKQELDSPDQIMEQIKNVLNTSSHKKRKSSESLFEIKKEEKRNKSFTE